MKTLHFDVVPSTDMTFRERVLMDAITILLWLAPIRSRLTVLYTLLYYQAEGMEPDDD